MEQAFSRYHHLLIHTRTTKKMSMSAVVRASVRNGNKETGLTLPQVSKIEAGKIADPHFGTVVKLARGYGLDINELVRFFDHPLLPPAGP